MQFDVNNSKGEACDVGSYHVAAPVELNVRRNIFKQIKDRLWGYDFFVSYHWASGGTYAVALAQKLRAKNFDVFLDRADYASGDDWKQMGEIALRNTQRLVLIATREAVLISKPVEREVQIFTDRGRHVIPIVFGDKFESDERAKSLVLSRMSDSQLFIEDARQSLVDGPSEETVNRLIQTHGVLRRRNLRAILTIIPAVMVILFLTLAILSFLDALESAKTANEEKEHVIVQRDAAREAEKTGNMILDVIEKKAQTDVVIHEVLMEATLVAINHLEKRKHDGIEARLINEDLAELYKKHAWHSDDIGQHDKAIEEYSRSLELLQELSHDQSNDAELLLHQTFLMNNIGNCYAAKNDIPKAIEQHLKTLAQRRKLLERFPNEFEARRQIGVSLGNLANVYMSAGQKNEGMKYAFEGLEFDEKFWKENPKNRWVGLNLSNGLADLSKNLYERGDISKAVEFRQRAYTLRRKLYEDAKAEVPSDDKLGLFNFEEKYGKIAYELADLLSNVDPKNKEIEGLFEEGVTIMGRLHERNQSNEGYKELYQAALDSKAKWTAARDKLSDSKTE